MKRRFRSIPYIIPLLRIRKQIAGKAIVLFGNLRRADQFFMITSAILIGIVTAFGAILFRHMIAFVQLFFFESDTLTAPVLLEIPWWIRLGLPAFGGLIAGPVAYFWAREVQGSGIPEVMESVATRGGIIRARVLLAKLIAATATIGSGGSAGREGPIVQIGSAIGSLYGQFISVSTRRLRTFVACGASAAIAATFNAPIGGALFAVEVILGDFAVTQFSAIVISSVVATVISRHYLGDSPAFEVPGYELVSPVEFLPYSILGLLAGLLAVGLMTAIYRSQDYFSKIDMPDYLKPALGGLGVGLIGLLFPEVFGVGYGTINEALWSREASLLLTVLIFAKIIATALTLGSGGSGGVFAPSLFLGALLGVLVGYQAQVFYPGMTGTTGAYALVGMGAMVAGATHAPISAILIIFELTNDYHIIPPLMVASIVAIVLSTYLKRESIYTTKLVQRGINIHEGRDVNVLRQIRVQQVLNTDIEILSSRSPFSEIMGRLIKSQHEECFVIDDQKELVGQISMRNFKTHLLDQNYLSNLVIAADLANPPVTTLYLEDNLDLAMHHFGRHDVDELPVLENHSCRRLVGSVRRQDVIDAYNQEIFKYELAGGMHSVVTAVSKDRSIELAKGFRMVETEPPNGFIGRSLKQLNIRARYGIEVILIRTSEESDGTFENRNGMIPHPDYIIKRGDSLLVMGREKDIRTLQQGILREQ